MSPLTQGLNYRSACDTKRLHWCEIGTKLELKFILCMEFSEYVFVEFVIAG